MKPYVYQLVGFAYMVLAVPSVVFLVMGRLSDVNIFYTIALGGVPLGALFLLFGFGRFKLNRLSQTALKFALVSLAGNLPLFAGLLLSAADQRVSSLTYNLVSNLAMVFIAWSSLISFFLAIFAILRGSRGTSSLKLRTIAARR